MKTSTMLWVAIIVIIVLLGGWYFLSARTTAAPATEVTPTADSTQGGPSVHAGINASSNQGNLGAPDTGAPQQPQQPVTQ